MNRILLLLIVMAPSCAPSGKVCEPLERQECTCTDGKSGFEYCNSTGHWWTPCDCACRPDCNSKTCGDDGCGGSCGECINRCTGEPDPSLCVTDTCQYVCCPHTCEKIAKECGSWHDGCGGFTECGPCAEGFFCIDGTCFDHDDVCTSDYDCPLGYECQETICQRTDGGPEPCITSDGCPPGYFCKESSCTPCPESPDLPECQIAGDECLMDDDCPPGFICTYGHCYPGNQSGVIIPVAWGSWDTRYYFDLTRTLGGFSTIDAVNQLNGIVNYCEYTGIGWIDDLVCDLILEYTSDWAIALVDIFANLGNILSELRSEGGASFVQLTREELLSAREEWHTISVRYLNACCEGQPPGCNPYNQPDFPECATIDIDTQDLQNEDVELVVHPYYGKIQVGDEDGAREYLLYTGPRLVEMEYSDFIVFLVNRLTQIFTGYSDLEAALQDIKDCEAIQELIDDISGGWAPDIRQLCENSKPTANSLLYDILGQIGPGLKPIWFKGWATITVVADPPYATHLGYYSFEEDRDGYLWGTGTIVGTGNIYGAWFGVR